MNKDIEEPGKDAMVEKNQQDSDANAALGEVEVQAYEDMTQGGEPQEDMAEVASTDDV